MTRSTTELNGKEFFTEATTVMLANTYLATIGVKRGVHLTLPQGTTRNPLNDETKVIAGVLLGIDLTSIPQNFQRETIKFLRLICPQASADIDAAEQLLGLNEPTIRILED